MENRFQSLPFKCNLQRYSTVAVVPVSEGAALALDEFCGAVVGLYKLNPADP